MITILHGDNVETSRNELNRLRLENRDKEIRGINGKGIDSAMLTQALESSSLFTDKTCVIIENLFSSARSPLASFCKGRPFEKYITLLTSQPKETTIILWENKELGKEAINLLGSATIRLFAYPKILFQFLDNLKPENAKQLLITFQTLIEHEPVELVFTMIVSRIRQLIQAKDGVTPSRMQPWQMSRLTNQAKSFTMDKLVNMHKKLTNIEYFLHTGSTPFTLTQLIEQLIVNKI